MADSFVIDAQDIQVQQLLKQLQEGISDMTPYFQDLGESMMSRTKGRFVTSTDPAGNAWKPNAQSTYVALANKMGKSNFGKDGRVNKKGADKLAAKKPLIGESRDLSRQFYVDADPQSVVFGNTMVYAAIQNFGGQAGRNKKVTIPARAFMPVMQNGEFYPDEQLNVMNLLSEYIDSVAGK